MLTDMRKIVGEHLQFAMVQLANKYHAVQIAATRIISRLSRNLVGEDLEQLNRSDQDKTTTDWHLLHKFRLVLQQQNDWAQQYIDEYT